MCILSEHSCFYGTLVQFFIESNDGGLLLLDKFVKSCIFIVEVVFLSFKLIDSVSNIFRLDSRCNFELLPEFFQFLGYLFLVDVSSIFSMFFL